MRSRNPVVIRSISKLVVEAVASARSQAVTSVLTILVVLGMVLAVMLTTGRTVASEQQIIGSIDATGTRAIVVDAGAGSGLTSSVLGRLSEIEGIEWAGGFSQATDGTNARIPGGAKAPIRYVYTDHPERLGLPAGGTQHDVLAWASDRGFEALGMKDLVGTVALTNGAVIGTGGTLRTPDYLKDLEPLILVPGSGSESEIALLIVVADAPELVKPVTEAVVSLLGVNDVTGIKVQASEELLELRALIQGQLGSFSRGIVLVMLAITGALVGIILFGLVMLRRRDFGRRRALGATRSFVVAMLLVQTLVLAVAGSVFGMVTSCVILLLNGDPLPSLEFGASLLVLSLGTTVLAAVVPAVVASRRDPLHELRVP